MKRIPTSLIITAIAISTAVASAQLGGVRGVVNRNLEGVGDHNQAIEDAINGNDPKPAVPIAPGTIKSGWITRKSRNASPTDVRLFFAYPAGLTKAKPAAALVVLQEWWGVNDDMQSRAKELAAKGFYVVEPDLYQGKVTDDPTEAAKLKDSLTDASALMTMKTGLDLLQEESTNGIVDAKRIGALGWCMGGTQALNLSLADPRIKATALFYGPLVTDSAKLRTLQGPFLGIFGNDDKTPSPEDVKKFQAALTAAGKTDVTIKQYDGVGHAFASKSAEKMGLYNEPKAQEAFAVLYNWLDQKLPR